MAQKKNSTKRQRVLSDHKQVGKTLISPVNAQIGQLGETSWMHTTLPELLWIDVLTWKLGSRKTLDILEVLYRESNKGLVKKTHWGCFASSYSLLSDKRQNALLAKLKTLNLLSDVQRALEPFLISYPECPLKFFGKHEYFDAIDQAFTHGLKDRIRELTNKRSRSAIFMQANAVYTALKLGWIQVRRGLKIAELHLLNAYPNTEESRIVGAGICATMNMMIAFQIIENGLHDWSNYFWNQGLILESIKFNYVTDEYGGT